MGVSLVNLEKNEAGVALILTIMVVSFIITLSLEFNRNMRTHVTSAGNIAHGLKALYAAKSGISHGFAILKTDTREVDSLRDNWANAERLAAINDASKGESGGSAFELKIEDLSGKIPINLMVDNEKVKLVFTRLLNLDVFGLDEATIGTILDSTLDWIDRAGDDDFHRINGAEDDWYQSEGKPYHCKNGPLDAPEELLLVRGMSPEIFYGNDEKPGIGQYITVCGDKEAKINLNTAKSAVLGALSSDYDGEALAGFREDAIEAELETGRWYDGKIDKNFTELVSTKSTYFEIVCQGQFGDAKKKVVSVVKRSSEKGDIQTLSRRVE